MRLNNPDDRPEGDAAIVASIDYTSASVKVFAALAAAQLAGAVDQLGYSLGLNDTGLATAHNIFTDTRSKSLSRSRKIK